MAAKRCERVHIAALICRSCGTRRYKPPEHMVKLTMEREITPYVWVHPDGER
jgi:hypothetical protein